MWKFLFFFNFGEAIKPRQVSQVGQIAHQEVALAYGVAFKAQKSVDERKMIAQSRRRVSLINYKGGSGRI